MYLHPEIRGQGYGHELLSHCLDAAREHGFERCYLETMSQMAAARKLYLRFGFQETDKPIGDTGHQCHRWMIRTL
jgi:putative acetyltransferase